MSSFNNQTITITFGDRAENHKGMEIIGESAESGFTLDDLIRFKDAFPYTRTELINLNEAGDAPDTEPAYVLVVRRGVDAILSHAGINATADELYEEQRALRTDSKAFMYGRVVNKHARHNLCFAEHSQEPDYEHGKGTIIAYQDVPLTRAIRENFVHFGGEKFDHLQGEGNYYYDIDKCGIGFHGDSERKKVVAMRLGESIPIHYQWFQDSKPFGRRVIIPLHHGDIYVMSEKAVGTDWKRKKVATLRHATGCDKFTTI